MLKRIAKRNLAPKILEINLKFPFSKEELLPGYRGKDNYELFKKLHSFYEQEGIKKISLKKYATLLIRDMDKKKIENNFIKKILQDNQIDFVLIYSIVTNAKAAIKACNELNIPLVHRTFDIIHDLIRENYLRGKVEKIEREVYPRFNKVIANTPFMEQWAKDMGATNVIVIPQGVDPDIMKPLDKDQQLLNKLGFSQTDKIVLSLGSIESFSGLDSLINRIPEIINKISEFKLLRVGGGSHLTNLQ